MVGKVAGQTNPKPATGKKRCSLGSHAAFILACHLTLCHLFLRTPLAVSLVEPQLRHCHYGLITRAALLPSWIEFNCLWFAKWQDYWFIGKTLLVAWSSLSVKWRLHSYTLYKYHHQIGKAERGKLHVVWKQRKSLKVWVFNNDMKWQTYLQTWW